MQEESKRHITAAENQLRYVRPLRGDKCCSHVKLPEIAQNRTRRW